MGRSWYHWAHEPCWAVRKPGIANLYIGARDQSTIWRAPSPKMIMSGSTEDKVDHPAQKPVVLSETPIRNHLAPGGLVYEPFAGSGTTLIAAERPRPFHPNFWGQLALRNCLRQAYNNGNVRGGNCEFMQAGLNAFHEPTMILAQP